MSNYPIGAPGVLVLILAVFVIPVALGLNFIACNCRFGRCVFVAGRRGDCRFFFGGRHCSGCHLLDVQRRRLQEREGDKVSRKSFKKKGAILGAKVPRTLRAPGCRCLT